MPNAGARRRLPARERPFEAPGDVTRYRGAPRRAPWRSRWMDATILIRRWEGGNGGRVPPLPLSAVPVRVSFLLRRPGVYRDAPGQAAGEDVVRPQGHEHVVV